jgi:hypothetical protein
MTAPKSRSISDDERSSLLNDLSTLKSDDDDAIVQDPKWFLPLAVHARALRLETLVVRGGRGAGKSSLFHFLGHLQKTPTLAKVVGEQFGKVVGDQLLKQTTWIEGFSSSVEHPSLPLVGAFGDDASDDRRRFFWFAWLCVRISVITKSPLPQNLLMTSDPSALADAGKSALSALSNWLDGIERAGDTALVITYDSLDRVGTSSATRGKMTESLLAMWLSLADRYRRIRPKIFVREDLFQASLSAFPDASKLDARSVSIEWRVEDLYRVLIKHMANTSDGLRSWVEGSTRGVPLTLRGPLGWTVPDALPETGKGSQQGFVDHLAGELMGSGTKKGLTYRWIPNRLQDAHSRTVPRSVLSLIRNAAHFALQRGPEAQSLRLLTPTELQGALDKTSQRRVNELKEEFPVVARLENLRGRTVMLARNRAVDALSRATAAPGDEHGSDGEQVIRSLIELGVVSERPDGRIDVPDIYRYGFGILRKGGVKRPR